MKYKITVTLDTIDTRIFVAQKPREKKIVITVPSTFVVELVNKILPPIRKTLGKNNVIVGIKQISL